MGDVPVVTKLLAEGFVLGWAVAWPPGPINAEMIRRGLSGHPGAGLAVGLGACSGDFIWALVVASGLGALASVPMFRPILWVVSLSLLLWLAGMFLLGAWRSYRAGRRGTLAAAPPPGSRQGFVLGLTLALTSPWNIGFWLAVLGNQSGGLMGVHAAITKALGVVGGALTWCLVLNTATRAGARFATPAWDVTTRALTGVLMLYFAAVHFMRWWA